jgi:hypothetical protein
MPNQCLTWSISFLSLYRVRAKYTQPFVTGNNKCTNDQGYLQPIYNSIYLVRSCKLTSLYLIYFFTVPSLTFHPIIFHFMWIWVLQLWCWALHISRSEIDCTDFMESIVLFLPDENIYLKTPFLIIKHSLQNKNTLCGGHVCSSVTWYQRLRSWTDYFFNPT